MSVVYLGLQGTHTGKKEEIQGTEAVYRAGYQSRQFGA